MPKIHPFLWFDTQAEAAADFYVSVFPNSKILRTMRNPEAAPGPTGGVLTVEFELDGFPVTALNGGPHFHFSEAVSFWISCKDQAEVDRYWEKLLDGGEPSQCGWLKDRFGFSWQVVPDGFFDIMNGSDPAGRERAMAAMMKMVKLDLATLQAAYVGEG
ncbi:VOC family protein [Phenylobacterium sp.]|uniref:VOC family protein n=1 Tax=Phenylobacterium sp. TaxID=1871053 RepID=UPI001215D202|nr:VOC family protein [Phenylobacterium sp.]THD58076.1 MAG: VOC family protein [Phenylobacterium sp.]